VEPAATGFPSPATIPLARLEQIGYLAPSCVPGFSLLRQRFAGLCRTELVGAQILAQRQARNTTSGRGRTPKSPDCAPPLRKRFPDGIWLQTEATPAKQKNFGHGRTTSSAVASTAKDGGRSTRRTPGYSPPSHRTDVRGRAPHHAHRTAARGTSTCHTTRLPPTYLPAIPTSLPTFRAPLKTTGFRLRWGPTLTPAVKNTTTSLRSTGVSCRTFLEPKRAYGLTGPANLNPIWTFILHAGSGVLVLPTYLPARGVLRSSPGWISCAVPTKHMPDDGRPDVPPSFGV